MYSTGDIIHFQLKELPLVSAIASMFCPEVEKKIDDIYYYHKCMLHENDNQPLQLTIDEKKHYLKKYISRRVYQPEFIFSDDEDLF